MRSSVRGSKLMVEPGSLSLASTTATSISAVSPGETVSVSAFDSESPVSGESGSSETRAVDSSSCGLTTIGSGADVDAGATSDAGAMGNAGAAGSGAANTAALSLIAAATGSAK